MKPDLSPRATEIANYAQELLEAGGYKNFSYADISSKIKITKASIHHHFANKTELVVAVVKRYRYEALAGMDNLDRQIQDPKEKLQAYLHYWLTCLKGDNSPFCLCAMLAFEVETLPDSVAKEVRKHFSDLHQWLESTFREGDKQDQFFLQSSPDVEAKAFMASVYGAMLSARGFGDPAAFKNLLQLTLDRLTLKA